MIYYTLALLISQINFWGNESAPTTVLPKTPLIQTAPCFVPSLVPIEDKYILAYELELKNTSNNIINIIELLILDHSSNKILKKYNKNNLQMSAKSIDPGAKILIYIWLEFPKNQEIPAKLWHRIKAKSPLEELVLKGSLIDLPTKKPIILGTPFKDAATWFAANSPSATSSHRLAITSLDNFLILPQRFAVDWLSVNNNGRAFINNGQKLDDWDGYGKDLVAVADGIIAVIKDNIPENIPGSHRAVSIDATTIAGNYVSLQIAPGKYVIYAHMIPGSIVVQANDRVLKGQILGKLGNSGNSDAPHLHLHVVDGPEPLSGQGLAYVHESFELLGLNDNFYSLLTGGDVFSPVTFSKNQQAKSNEMPGENFILKFSNAERY